MSNKLLRKSFLILLPLLGAFVFAQHSFAVQNANDEIYIVKPIRDEVVSGTSTIQWYMFDPDMQTTLYDIDLFSLSCEENGTYFGKIASGIPPAHTNHVFAKEWNTKGPIVNVASIADGRYCLRACGFFVNQPGNHYYGLCDKHTIVINNSGNQPPVIGSQPNDLDLKVGESFEYQVVATDPNGDALTYKLAAASEFFDISAAGLLKSKSTLNAAGIYKLTVVVEDGKGGKAEQPITINVTAGEVELGVSFLKPKATDVFTKSGNEVAWIVNSEKNILKTILSISDDAKTWQEVIELKAETTYVFDASEFANGEYYFHLALEDVAQNKYEAVSAKFIIDNDKQSSGEIIPFISELRPEDGSQITDLRPDISALISPADSNTEIEMEQISLELDAQSDGLECAFADKRLTCTLENDLELGVHQLFLSVTDATGKTEIKEWSFEVVTVTPTEVTPGDNNVDGGFSFTELIQNLSSSTIRSALTILCVGLTLLLIPWLLYFAWKRMRGRNMTYVASDDPFAPAAATTTVVSTSTPLMASSADVFDTNFEPTIGSQTMGEIDEGTQFTSADLGGIDPNQTADSMIAQPSTYSAEEVPDWLKDFESTPLGAAVNQSGGAVSFADADNSAAADAAGAKVHDAAGIDLNLDETSDK